MVIPPLTSEARQRLLELLVTGELTSENFADVSYDGDRSPIDEWAADIFKTGFGLYIETGGAPPHLEDRKEPMFVDVGIDWLLNFLEEQAP